MLKLYTTKLINRPEMILFLIIRCLARLARLARDQHLPRRKSKMTVAVRAKLYRSKLVPVCLIL